MLTQEACSHVMRSLVLSRLDYGNALLINTPRVELERLQRLQNRAARIVLRARRQDSATPLLHRLHWLPVHKRIVYKIALFVYKCTHNFAPGYLHTLLSVPTQAKYNLRSRVDTSMLMVPRTNLKGGERSFHFAGPTVWNSLPLELRLSPTVDIFKRNLKTYLFLL